MPRFDLHKTGDQNTLHDHVVPAKGKVMSKNFILGVGCQKGGTTWLHSQLIKSQHADMGFRKEYHVLDTRYIPECRPFLNRLLTRLTPLPEDLEGLSEKRQQLKLLSFHADINNYYDYFDHLWYRGGADITAVGDITPSYSGLPIEALKTVKSELKARGFTIKIIYLMRDPIERCWSALRMRRKARLQQKEAVLPSEEDHLEYVFSTKEFADRTRYESTVSNLDSVFDQNEIFYCLYERLFDEKTLKNLKSFLELPDLEPDTSFRINTSEKSKTLRHLDNELASKIFHYYKDTYEYCEKRFGTRDLWSGWEHS